MTFFTSLVDPDFVSSLSSKESCLADELLQRKLELIGDKLIHDARTIDSDDAMPLKYAAAIAYYLSGFYARAYVILANTEQHPPPLNAFKLLRRFFLKEFSQLEKDADDALSHPNNSDQSLAVMLESGTITVREAIEQIVVIELGDSLAAAWRYACNGELQSLDAAIGKLDVLRQVAQDPLTGLNDGYQWVLCGASVLLKEFRENALRTQLDAVGMLREPKPAGEIANKYVQSAARRSAPLVELWRSQTIALPKINEVGDLGRPSFLLKAPTSAGKTNIAELAIVRFLMDTATSGDTEKKCLYIAPFRALASEIERKLRKHMRPLNIWVTELYGGSEISPADRMQFQTARVLVATPEKVEALLRCIPEFADQIGLIIIDEGHVIDAGERGLRFEMLLQRLIRRFSERETRLIFVSAVMGNADQISQWITGQGATQGLVGSDFRPTTNYLGVLRWDGNEAHQVLTHHLDGKKQGYRTYQSQTNKVAGAMPSLGQKRFPRASKPNEAVALAALRLAREGVTLVFSPRPDSCESIVEGALAATEYARECISKAVEIDPVSIKVPVAGSPSFKRWKRCEGLAQGIAGKNALVTRALEAGIVMHHGELPEKLRDELAILLQEGDLPLVVATSTIIHGVNSPVRTIIARTLVRGYINDHPQLITATEFFNLAGRAGRAMKENEGALLVYTTPNKELATAGQIKQYVGQQNYLQLQSQLKTFLHSVAMRWREVYPDASLAILCSQLAEDNINWLTLVDQQFLTQLDISLMAAIEEQDLDIDCDPNIVQKILEGSLLNLQCPPDSVAYKTSIAILAARIENLAKLPSDDRHRFYHSGLSLNDYHALESKRDDIILLLTRLSELEDWTDTQRVDFLCELYQDVLGTLPILRAMDGSTTWPNYISAVLKEWLLGTKEEDIAVLSVVQAEHADQATVIKALDKLRGYRLPMAMNALRAYLDALPSYTSSLVPSEPNQSIRRHVIQSALGTCIAMISHGVPSSKAALFMGLGLESRTAAIRCALHYTGENSTQAIYEWFGALDESTFAIWGCDAQMIEDIHAFQDRVRDGLAVFGSLQAIE